MAVIVHGPKPKETRRLWVTLPDGTVEEQVQGRTITREGRYNWNVGRWRKIGGGKPTHPLRSAYHYVKRREFGNRRKFYKKLK